MPRVLMNFMFVHKGWRIHFLEEDCRTEIGARTYYFHLKDEEELRAFLLRCNPEDTTLEKFEHGVKWWHRGSEFVHLTDEQYAKLKNRYKRREK